MTIFDLIGKLRYIMEMLVDTIQLGLIAGKKVTISESMIKYFATAVSFIQYLPIKSIKHGIQVLAVCCTYTESLLSVKIYLGKNTVHM